MNNKDYQQHIHIGATGHFGCLLKPKFDASCRLYTMYVNESILMTKDWFFDWLTDWFYLLCPNQSYMGQKITYKEKHESC